MPLSDSEVRLQCRLACTVMETCDDVGTDIYVPPPWDAQLYN